MILVSGSLALDYIMSFTGSFTDNIMPDKIHMFNMSFSSPEMKKGFGGTGGNIAYNLSLLNHKAVIISAVGNDFGPYKKFLKKQGIKTTYIKDYKDLHTATAFGITDKKDNQIWGFHPGADKKSVDLSLDEVDEDMDFAIIAAQNHATMLERVEECSKHNIPYLFDPGMALPNFSGDELEKVFKQAKIIIGNDYEAEVMKKKTGASFSDLSKGGKIAIITLGAKGSNIFTGDKEYKVEAVKVNAVDPSGAGDAYRAGFVVGYLKEMPVDVCGKMGSVCASFAVEKHGTMNHHFTLEEFINRYKSNYSQNLEI